MSRTARKDPRQGNAGDLGEWLANPKNRAKMYRNDREAAAELKAMAEAEAARMETPTVATSATSTALNP